MFCGHKLKIPPRGSAGQQQHGLTIGDRVKVEGGETHYRGRCGRVHSFTEIAVFVDLEQHGISESECQWFMPNHLVKDSIK